MGLAKGISCSGFGSLVRAESRNDPVLGLNPDDLIRFGSVLEALNLCYLVLLVNQNIYYQHLSQEYPLDIDVLL